MFQGIRIPATEKGFINREKMRQPGAYGRATFDFVAHYGPNMIRNTYWEVTAPDGSGCLLAPEVHTVTEHEDGTITVHPSIVTDTWHGWLKHGVWTLA